MQSISTLLHRIIDIPNIRSLNIYTDCRAYKVMNK